MIYLNVFQIVPKGTQPLPLSPESRSLLSPQGKARWVDHFFPAIISVMILSPNLSLTLLAAVCIHFYCFSLFQE